MHVDRRTLLTGTAILVGIAATNVARADASFGRNAEGATMTDPTTPLQIALAYHRAWTSGDLDRAMQYVAEAIVCDAPAGRIEGAEAYRAFMAPFVKMLKGTKLLAAFGDDITAIVMYDTHTALVESAPGAEWVTVRNGKIIYSRFLFDRLPFDEARRKVQR
jgi:hypothetical protein